MKDQQRKLILASLATATLLVVGWTSTASAAPSNIATRIQLAEDLRANCQLLADNSTGAQQTRALDCVADQNVILGLLNPPSPSPSVSPSASPSPSISPSVSPSPTPSPTPTVPPTPTLLKNCFSQLVQCGYPSQATTGYPLGLTLTAYQGPMNVTTSTTVIDGKRIPCGLNIRATQVVIRNSLITGSCFWGIQVYSGDLTITNSEITCINNTGTGLWGPNFKASNLYIHNCENALEINSNSQIVDSYLSVAEASSSGHGDDIQSQGGNNVVIRHNTFAGLNDITSSIITNPTANNSWLIEDNFLSAGAYTLYCPEQGTNFTVRNNRFYPYKNTAGQLLYKELGDRHAPAFGFTDACGHGGINWSGNYIDNTLAILVKS